MPFFRLNDNQRILYLIFQICISFHYLPRLSFKFVKICGRKKMRCKQEPGKNSWLRSLNNCVWLNVIEFFFSTATLILHARVDKTKLFFFQIYWKCLSFNWKISKVFLQHHIHLRNIASISQVVWNFWLFKWNSKFGIVVLLHSKCNKKIAK